MILSRLMKSSGFLSFLFLSFSPFFSEQETLDVGVLYFIRSSMFIPSTCSLMFAIVVSTLCLSVEFSLFFCFYLFLLEYLTVGVIFCESGIVDTGGFSSRQFDVGVFSDSTTCCFLCINFSRLVRGCVREMSATAWGQGDFCSRSRRAIRP